jgi:hypothetical protein
MDVIGLYVQRKLEGGERRPKTIQSALLTFRHFEKWLRETERGHRRR